MGTSNPFQLLYRIETEGLEQLDGVSRAQARISLETKYSTDALRLFDTGLRTLTTSGYSYRDAISTISRSTQEYGQTVSQVARDVLANDRAMMASRQQLARERQQADAEDARSAMAASQINIRLAREAAAAEEKSAQDAWRTRQRLWQQEQAERRRIAAQQESDQRRLTGGLLRGSGMPGGYMMAGGGAAAIGIGAAMGVAGIVSMTRDAAQGAQELQNLANEFGTTTSRMFQFQAAARLAGTDIGTMTQALRRISEAMEDPGGSGKQAAKAMTDLGVSLNQGVEPALTQVLQSLDKMTDTQRRASDGAALLGRNFQPLIEAGRNLSSTGDGINDNVTKRLVEANREIANLDNHWTILKANLAAGVIIPILTSVRDMAVGSPTGTLVTRGGSPITNMYGIGSMINLMAGWLGGNGGAPNAPRAPGVPSSATLATPLDYSRANRALSNSSTLSLDDQITTAKSAYETARSRLGNAESASREHPGTVTQPALDAEAQKVDDLRSNYERLEAQKKSAARSYAAPDALSALAERAFTGTEQSPLAAIDREQAAFFRDQTRRYGAPLSSGQTFAANLYFQMERNTARANIQSQFSNERDRLGVSVDRANEENLRQMTANAWLGLDPMARYMMFPDMNAQTIEESQARARQTAQQRQAIQMGLQFQSGAVTRQFGLERTLRTTSGTNTPGQDYSASIQQANALLSLRALDISQEDDADKRSMDAQRAKYEYIEAQDQARIQREEQIAQIAQQQAKETGSFLSGIVNAALSRDRHALPNFFVGFGRQTLDKVVSNFGEDAIGGMQNYVGLGRTGLLGTANQPNFFGKLLKGTPLDFAAKEYNDPVKAATDANTTATIANTDALNALMQTGGGSGSGVHVGSGSGGAGSFSLPGNLLSAGNGAANVARAVQSGNPLAIYKAATAAIPSFGGILPSASSSTGALDQIYSMANGGTAGNGSYPRMSMGPVFGGGSNAYSDLNSTLPIAGAGFSLPNLGSAGNGIYSSAPSLTAADAATLGMTSPASNAGMARLANMGTSVPATMASPTTDLSNINNFAKSLTGLSKVGGAAGTFGGNFGTGLQSAMSGYGLGDLLNGSTYDVGGGAAVAGSIAGMGGAVAGGTLQAIKGFGQGGARGDLSGIAGIATAAAPFTGPAAPFVEAGASLLDLVGALFGDPRAERQKQQTETLLAQAFIQPAAHNYSFDSSGGGYTSSAGGGGSAGGDVTHNHTWNLNMLDAKSAYELMQSDPAQLSNMILTGMTSGSSSALNAVIAYVAQNGSI